MSGCDRRAVDRHFAARLAPDEEHRLREHLAGCAECRAYYERHLLLAKLDPKALSAEARIAAGLGLAPARAAHGWAWTALAGGVAAAALLIFVARAPAGFTARGGHVEDHADVAIYRVAGGATARAAGRLNAGDALAFAYRNPDRWQRLLVFAVDETERVYWYWPKWTDPAADPRAIEIRPSQALVELGEAVTHPIAGRRLSVHALFTNEEPTVREIEARLAKHEPPSPGGRDVTTTLEVVH